MKKAELVKYLNTYLKSKTFDDPWFLNDLEVDSKKDEIMKIGVAVDCTTYIIDNAAKADVDMLLVHHGLHADPELAHFERPRVKKLIENNMALYCSHAPLDAHPVVGNNILLVQAFTTFFGIKKYKISPFGTLGKVTFGFAIDFKDQISVTKLRTFAKHIGIQYDFRNFGNKKYLQSVAFVSGSANDILTELMQKPYDLYITGELKHSSFCKAKEIKQSILLGGHYETEVFGVRALAQHLEKKFKIKTVFLDEKY